MHPKNKVRQSPSDIAKAARLYADLMEEIKRRTAIIQSVLNGAYSMPAIAGFELCYIQLRKICEIFSLACLAAHGDIPGVQTKLLQKTYNADLIIKQLANLHPNFYPVPGNQRLDPQSQKPVEVIPITSGFLTKQDFLDLYGECGNYLHRGSIRQLLTKWEPVIEFKKIKEWTDKIVTLLNHHQIQTSRPGEQFWVIMNAKSDGKVHVAEMKRLA